MIEVVRIIDKDVLNKIDAQYVKSKLSHVDLDAVLVFICTNENWRKEDTWKHKGETYYAIRLPYQQLKEMEDIRPLMLELAAKRLGIAVPGEAGAVN